MAAAPTCTALHGMQPDLLGPHCMHCRCTSKDEQDATPYACIIIATSISAYSALTAGYAALTWAVIQRLRHMRQLLHPAASCSAAAAV